MDVEPLVSVVIITYNQAPFIQEALQSVFAQTLKQYEVIVVDDDSTDDTPSRIASFGESVVHVRQKHQGSAAARNAGVRRARGRLIAFLDGDDVWEPEKLAAQVSAAEEYPGSGLIAADGVGFSDAGVRRTSLLGRVGRAVPEGSVSSRRCYEELLEGQFIATPSQVLIPSRVFGVVGMWDGRFALSSDYDLYLRISAKYDVTVIKRQLTRYRYLETSVSGPAEVRPLRWGEGGIAVLKNHLRMASTELRPVIRRRIQRKIFETAQAGYYYGRQVDRRWARRYLFKLLKRNPASLCVPVFFIGLLCPQALAGAFGPLVRKWLEPQGIAH